MSKVAIIGALVPVLVACNPEFANRFSMVDAPRVLAVQSTPAQVAPKKDVSYRVLVVDQTGTVEDASIDWSFCTHAKPISELNDVAQECFATGEDVSPFAHGNVASGTVPDSACRQFGPDIPVTKPGEAAARPTDADSSGGYYQPVILSVRATGGEISTLAETRLSCGLANSTGEQLESYQLLSKANENPKLTQVVATSLGNAVLEDGAMTALSVPRGEVVTLRASWPTCPVEPSCGDGMCTPGESITTCEQDCTTPIGCTGAETYAYLDPAANAIVPRHEAMRLSWFATQGSFRDDHTGRVEDEFATPSSDNTWQAPSVAGTVYLWVVLRDARGGVDWQSFQLDVR